MFSAIAIAYEPQSVTATESLRRGVRGEGATKYGVEGEEKLTTRPIADPSRATKERALKAPFFSAVDEA